MNKPGASSHNAGMMHTLQRHRDILQVHTYLFILLKLLYFIINRMSCIYISVYCLNQDKILLISTFYILCRSLQHHELLTAFFLFYLLGLYTWIPQNQKQLLHPERERGSARICSQRDRVSCLTINYFSSFSFFAFFFLNKKPFTSCLWHDILQSSLKITNEIT